VDIGNKRVPAHGKKVEQRSVEPGVRERRGENGGKRQGERHVELGYPVGLPSGIAGRAAGPKKGHHQRGCAQKEDKGNRGKPQEGSF